MNSLTAIVLQCSTLKIMAFGRNRLATGFSILKALWLLGIQKYELDRHGARILRLGFWVKSEIRGIGQGAESR